MQDWRLAGFFVMTCFVALSVSASGTGGGGADGATGGSLTGTSWNLVALAGEDIDPALPAVTLRFDADGTLGGFDGCNRYRGAFSVAGTAIHIPSEMATTRAACREPLTRRASAYAEALGRAASFAVDANRLSLQDAAGREVAVFEAGSLTLAGTAWEVMAYNNGKQAVVSVLGGTRITAHYGDDGRVTGSAGCNQYFAGYEVEGESISIALPGATRRFCAEPEGIMDQEARFLEALRSAASFRLEGERLALRTPDGALALTLVRGTAAASTSAATARSGIRFDLDRLNADGLQGPPDGLRALHYEYCIPDRPEAVREVTAIDPTLQIQRGSPGRVGCGADELLCLGHTHQPGHRAVLDRLAALPFVAEIREAFFE
jgi:heat shock protein HslJ